MSAPVVSCLGSAHIYHRPYELETLLDLYWSQMERLVRQHFNALEYFQTDDCGSSVLDTESRQFELANVYL